MRSRYFWTPPAPVSRAAAGAVLATAVGLAAACGGARPAVRPADAAEPVQVRIVEVQTETVPDVRRYPASLEPEARIRLASRLLAVVDAVRRREGEAVRSGETLVRLDDHELRAALEQARAALQRAEAEQARAEAQFRRMERLFAKGSATRKNLEDAEAAYRVATAARAEARAAVTQAETRLAYAEIRAPRDAWVVERHVEPGDTVAPGRTLMVLEDQRRLRVRFEVPASEAFALEPGAPVSVVVPGRPEAEARIRTVVPSADRSSRTVRVEAWLDRAEGWLRPGSLVEVLVATAPRPRLRIPARALVRRGGLEGVFVVDGEGRARLRWLRLGETSGDAAEVLSGLEAGERIVAEPPPGLRDGTQVREG